MGKSDNGKANLHMYCLQGNVRPFFKTILDFLSLGKKKQQKNLKKTKKAKKNPENLFKSMKVCVYYCVLVNSIRNKTGKNDSRKPKNISYLLT